MIGTPNGRILAGFGIGAGAGLAANLAAPGTPQLDWTIRQLADPIGQIFLRMLLMVVIPLVFASLTTGLARLQSVGSMGRIGGRTVATYLGLALLGSLIGATLASLVQPGAMMTGPMREAVLRSIGATPIEPVVVGIAGLVNIVPGNVIEAAAKGDALAVLFFTLIFGVALAKTPAAVAAPVIGFLEGLLAVVGIMVTIAMAVAPLGVAAIAFTNFARFGLEFLGPLGLFVGVVIAGLLVQQFVVHTVLVRIFGGRPAAPFFAASRPAVLTGFTTASSNATMPTTLRVAEEELGVSRVVAGFVVPLGASVSRGGTAVFVSAAALFLAQALGIGVAPSQWLTVVVLATVASVASGGVPSGVVPLLASVVAGVGVPSGAVALVLGVEPLLGMVRTAVNVTGSLATTLVASDRRADVQE